MKCRSASASSPEDVSETLAAVLIREPDWAALPSGLSPTLLVFLRRCLHKDLKQRMGDIHDVRLALEGATTLITGGVFASVSAKSLNYIGQRDCERYRSSKTG